MNLSPAFDPEETRNSLPRDAGANRVALVFHLGISDASAYRAWLAETNGKLGSKRLNRVKVDPIPREGMVIDEIVIDEHPSAQSALEFMATYGDDLKQACRELAVLAIVPEPPATFHMVRVISWLVRLFKGVKDEGIPSSNWKAENTAIWPDERQMAVARNQNLDEPLFVYNLNKYKAVAEYPADSAPDKPISGREAYDRYAKIAGFELLRRGAFPVYGGRPLGLLEGNPNCILADRWDKFIFVRYPRRRNLLAIIESPEFTKGQIHRDAGLERVAIFMAGEA